MSSTPTNTSGAAGAIATAVDNFLIGEIRDTVLMRMLAREKDLTGERALGHTFPRLSNALSTLDMQAISNGASEAAAQSDVQLTTDTVTLTPAVKFTAVTNSKINEMAASVDWDATIRGILARSAADKVDVDLATLFSGFSTSVGTSGAQFSISDFRAGQVALRKNAKMHAGRSAIVAHPDWVGDLTQDITGGGNLASIWAKPGIVSLFGEEGVNTGLMEAYVGSLLGTPVFQTTNVQKINTNADWASGLFVLPNPADENDNMCALGITWKWSALINKFDLTLLMQVAFRYTVDEAYAVGELKDEMGVLLVSKVAS